MIKPTDPAFPWAQDLGLTKREYFAALAMQAFIGLSADAATAKLAPKAAVALADSLIEALNEKELK